MSTTALAPAPQRASNSFTLAFGVLNIPLGVYTGTEETRVSRNEFLDGDASIPVGRSPIRKDTGEVIPSDRVVRMAEASNGAWVVLTDDEIADCTCPKGVGDIVTFIPVKDVGNYAAQDVAQVRPKAVKGKADAAGEKAFALLLTVLRKKKVVALVRVALRGPARYALLAADGSFTYVRTADQVREARDLNDGFKFSAAELALAEALLDAVGTSTPVLTDDTAPAVRAFVDNKAKGVPAPAKPAVPVIGDLMADLQASIDAAKAAKGKVA
jgi:non-homologous end joining protein Ku